MLKTFNQLQIALDEQDFDKANSLMPSIIKQTKTKIVTNSKGKRVVRHYDAIPCNDEGENILMLAGQNGYFEMVKFIVNHPDGKILLTSQNNDGYTPIMLWVKQIDGCASVLALAAKNKNSIICSDSMVYFSLPNLKTLDTSECYNYLKEVISIEDNYPSDKFSEDLKGVDGIEFKVRKIYKCIKLLLEMKEIDSILPMQDKKGDTFLHTIVQADLIELAKLVLAKNLPNLVNIKNKDGISPLILAKNLDNNEMIEILTKK